MSWQERHFLPKIDNPKQFLLSAMGVSNSYDSNIANVWQSFTSGEARFAINKIWQEAEEGQAGLCERLKNVVKQSQGDFQADPGLLEIMTEKFTDEQFSSLADGLKKSAATIIQR